MYRNVHYSIDSDWQGHIDIWDWDELGNRRHRKLMHNSYLYYADSKGTDGKSIFGENLVRMEFKSVASRKQWLNKHKNINIYECLPPVREFLIHEYEGKQESDDFQQYPLRIYNIDIEVAAGDNKDESMPQLAIQPINVLTCHDYLDKIDHVFYWIDTKNCKESYEVIHNKIKKIKTKYPDSKIKFYEAKSEDILLEKFLSFWTNDYPDILTGWFIDVYDVPYLIKRIKKILGDDRIHDLSPVGKISKKSYMVHKRFANTHRFAGITTIDYAYLDANKFARGSKQSYALEARAQEELGVGKNKNPYPTMKDFWQKDFAGWVEYNIIDVKRVKEIDEKLKFIDLARKICNIGLCEYEAIHNSLPYIFGALTLEARSQGKRILSINDKEVQRESYTGAFVFPSQVDVYRKGLMSLDFNSLYPNIMILLNISPDTKIGTIIHKSDDFVRLKTRTGIKNIPVDKLKEMFDKQQAVISFNNVLYISPTIKQGFIPSFLTRMYDYRKKYKKLVDKGKNALIKFDEDNVKISVDQRTKIKDKMGLYDNIQQAVKIFINSIYGAVSSNYFSMCDYDNAEAVTLTGQNVLKEIGKKVNNYYFNTYKDLPEDFNPIVAGDTDSLYLNTAPITESILGEKPKFNKTNTLKLCKKLDQIVEAFNNECFEFTQQRFKSPLRRIEFKRETFCSEAAFTAKKRYMLHIRNEGGNEFKSKFKYTGLDIKKNEIPDSLKDELKNIVEDALIIPWSDGKYQDKMENLWKRFKELGPDGIARLQNLGTPKKEIGFMKVEKGAQNHARGAVYYNQIIDDLQLNHKYDKIVSGTRMHVSDIKSNNKYGIDTMCWIDEYPEEFDKYFQIDYKSMFSKNIQKPLKPFEQIFGWSKFNPSTVFVTNVLDL